MHSILKTFKRLKDLTKDERVVFIQYCRNYIALCKALVDAGSTAPSSLRNDIATLTRYVIDTIALDQPNDDGERPNNDTLGNQFGALSITSPDVRAKLDLENEHSSIEEEVCEVDDIPAVSEDLVSLAALPLCSCCQEQINMSISQYVPRVLVCGHVHCTGCILSLLEAEVMTCQTCFENTACINVDALPVWTNSSFKEELTSAKKTSVSESISSSRFRSQLFSPTSSALSSWTGVYFAPLGEGSFGQTSLWYMPSIMVIVVLKRTDDDEAKTLMRSEHIILTKLCHPNIIQTYGIFNFQDAYLALALPYYPDGDVANFLKENSWCTAKVMFVMLQITSVNCYLLVNNLCHGDFKPENFLISGDCKVVVADFGACGCIGDEITVRTDAYADREETHFSEFTDSYASARCLMAFATRKVTSTAPKFVISYTIKERV